MSRNALRLIAGNSEATRSYVQTSRHPTRGKRANPPSVGGIGDGVRTRESLPSLLFFFSSLHAKYNFEIHSKGAVIAQIIPQHRPIATLYPEPPRYFESRAARSRLMGSSPHNPAGQPQPEETDVIQLPSRDSLDFPDTNSSTESDDYDSVDTAIYDGGPARRTLRPAPLLINHRRLPSADEDDTDHDHDSVIASNDQIQEEKPVTWSSLPKKGQLAILTFARLSEPLTQTSLQAYMFYQLKSFDPSLPDSTISAQAGIMQGSFTAAQFLTAVWWGRLADAEWMGRKRVLLIGLLGTCISCLGFGFSRSFTAAIIFRTVGGVLNSNVGVMRTLIAEIIAEKKYVTHVCAIDELPKLRR